MQTLCLYWISRVREQSHTHFQAPGSELRQPFVSSPAGRRQDSWIRRTLGGNRLRRQRDHFPMVSLAQHHRLHRCLLVGGRSTCVLSPAS